MISETLKPVMSPVMRQYLTHWLHWAETGEGFEDGQSYNKTEGLCYNAGIYCDADSDSLCVELLVCGVYAFQAPDTTSTTS